VTARRPRLAFISPVFLFPNDAGGKIRTTNVLRGLRHGAFDVTLASPATPQQAAQWAAELTGVCDEFVPWAPAPQRPRWARGLDLLDTLPVNVVADRTAAGLAAVDAICRRDDIDLVVFDFVHAAVLRPARVRQPTVCFTHNVEAEIFARHAQKAPDAWRRWMWSSQHRKMSDFESHGLRQFNSVITVSERDAAFFRQSAGLPAVWPIPTGVDLDFFSWSAPAPIDDQHPPTVVFTGSMDWAANIDGVQFFLAEVWPQVLQRLPHARFRVVGRHPPSALVAQGQRLSGVSFTGFVDDVRPHVRDAHAFVIPLLVGGGTRIKAFEALAMGCPLVSTTLGIEGLEVVDDEHFVRSDTAPAMADALVALLTNDDQRMRLSQAARALVEARFGHREVAQVFEQICLRTLAPSASLAA
jgi:glycosyltransferase involved in cell wall biosynthesis